MWSELREPIPLPHGIFINLPKFSEIDVAFFVVTVDLWSADGKQEMNLNGVEPEHV